jgi:hypothetical protein
MNSNDAGGRPKGLPLVLDPNAKSASTTEPAFIARPVGAPVYHGFAVLEDVTFEGFTLGIITSFEAELTEEGDAFVIAPDNSRCGLVWEIGLESRIEEIIAPEPQRWGVYSVVFTHPMRNRDDARVNLRWLVPQLRGKWEQWRSKQDEK